MNRLDLWPVMMQMRSDLIYPRVFCTVTLMQRSFHLVVGTALSYDDGIFFAFFACVMKAMDLVRHNGTLVRPIDVCHHNTTHSHFDKSRYLSLFLLVDMLTHGYHHKHEDKVFFQAD